jgi:hypothetical protein
MNKEKLINQYEKMKANKKRLTSVDLVLKDLRSLDEPEPLPFKLKDVVGRIRGFDPTTQTRWLNDILKELGGDYGSMKYRDGYEQGKLEGMVEREKVRVPEFIEDWIFECQLLKDFSLRSALDSTTIHLYAKNGKVVKKWLNDRKNQEIFARAWLFDYEAEKEPKYKVKVKNTDDYLNETEVGFHFFDNNKKNKTFTRQELEYSDFSWVLDCPGIELEEVE